MFDITNAVGHVLSLGVCLGILMGLVFVTIVWQCPMCGKTQSGTIIQFLLLWCDHRPDTQ